MSRPEATTAQNSGVGTTGPRLRISAYIETIILLGGFVVCYDYLYRNFLSPNYEYLGFQSNSTDPFEFVFACAAVLAVLFSLPSKLQRFSDYFLWFLYAIVYVPGVVTASRMGTLEGGSFQIVTLVTLSMFLLLIITRFSPAPYLPIAGRSRFSSLVYMIWISTISLLLLVAVYYPIMNIPSIDAIYDQRALAGAFGVGRAMQYILNWTAYAFIPILLTHGIIRRNFGLAAFGIFGLFIIFMINGAKIVFVIVLIMVFINTLFSYRLIARPGRLLLIPLVPTLTVLVLILIFGTSFSSILNLFVSQILMRAIAIQAVMLTVYAEFFDTNALTYMSHVTGFSSIIQYPYSQPIGFEIGIHLVGGTGFNANSGFWATDGIASFGMIGIPIASVFVSLFLVLINMVGARTDLRFLCVVLTPFCLAVANTSFFTAFITGGGLIAVVLSTKLPIAFER